MHTTIPGVARAHEVAAGHALFHHVVVHQAVAVIVDVVAHLDPGLRRVAPHPAVAPDCRSRCRSTSPGRWCGCSCASSPAFSRKQSQAPDMGMHCSARVVPLPSVTGGAHVAVRDTALIAAVLAAGHLTAWARACTCSPGFGQSLEVHARLTQPRARRGVGARPGVAADALALDGADGIRRDTRRCWHTPPAGPATQIQAVPSPPMTGNTIRAPSGCSIAPRMRLPTEPVMYPQGITAVGTGERPRPLITLPARRPPVTRHTPTRKIFQRRPPGDGHGVVARRPPGAFPPARW